MDQKRIEKYFTVKPALKPIVICSIIGILSLPLGGLGIIFLLIAVFLARGFFGRATEAEVDEFVRKTILPKQRERALKKLGLEWGEVDQVKPIELWGYSVSDVLNIGPKYYIWIRGQDGKTRAPEVALNAFYFSDDTVHYCRWIVSLIFEAERITTNEIYYSDIVSVKQDTEDIKTKAGDVTTETFAIRNTGGEVVSCPTANNSELETAVTAFRTLLKNKKTAPKTM